ncbi:MAG: HAD family hydrolase [Armatimonadota bacterium]
MTDPRTLPDAVIFDMDGLLVDTETCDYHAWLELHQAHGLELTLPDYCHHAGLYGSWDRMYAAVAAHSGVPADQLHARREPRFRELVSACLEPSPELLRLLGELKENQVRRGIASSSDSDWVAYLLEGTGLRSYFEVVATGHDVAHRKPAPDVYLLAAERLKVDPKRCVALEDSCHGIAAAQAAGMRVIAIPNLVSAHQDLSAADARVEHFGDVTLEMLSRLVTP